MTLYPGLEQFVKSPKGCIKTETNYNRQVTDTSAINVFFSDKAFRKIVLGENYFKLTGLDSEFVAPEMCFARRHQSFEVRNFFDQEIWQ